MRYKNHFLINCAGSSVKYRGGQRGCTGPSLTGTFNRQNKLASSSQINQMLCLFRNQRFKTETATWEPVYRKDYCSFSWVFNKTADTLVGVSEGHNVCHRTTNCLNLEITGWKTTTTKKKTFRGVPKLEEDESNFGSQRNFLNSVISKILCTRI